MQMMLENTFQDAQDELDISRTTLAHYPGQSMLSLCCLHFMPKKANRYTDTIRHSDLTQHLQAASMSYQLLASVSNSFSGARADHDGMQLLIPR